LTDNFRTFHLPKLRELLRARALIIEQFERKQLEFDAQKAIWRVLKAIAPGENICVQAGLAVAFVKEELRLISAKLAALNMWIGELENELFGRAEQFDDWNSEPH